MHTVPGAAGVGVQEAGVSLFSLFLFEKSLLFKPASPNKHLAYHTAQPGSLPRILEQTLKDRAWCCSPPGPCAGPRDLIVLKHFPYHLTFQCPLQFLVSNLHICWDTVGCSLCSSDDWLGVSLVHRGKWTLFPPTLLPYSFFSIHFSFNKKKF